MRFFLFACFTFSNKYFKRSGSSFLFFSGNKEGRESGGKGGIQNQGISKSGGNREEKAVVRRNTKSRNFKKRW